MRPLLEVGCDGKANIPQNREKIREIREFLAAEAYGLIIVLFPAAARALLGLLAHTRLDGSIGKNRRGRKVGGFFLALALFYVDNRLPVSFSGISYCLVHPPVGASVAC